MRYERVQEILENELALRNKLGPRSVPVETRFNEKVYFSDETIKVTQALHAEGRDAHKVPKHEVLLMAAKVMRVIPGNGEARPNVPPPAEAAVSVAPPAPPAPPATPPEKRKPQALVKPKAKTVLKPKIKAKKPEAKTPEAPARPKAAAKPRPKPQRKIATPEQKKPQPSAPPAAKKPAKPQRPKTEAAKPTPPEPVAEDPLPESELPPEKQPLRLPANFDPRNHPHYSVQSSIYSLLLSALAMSEAFEKFPGLDERQRDLGNLVKKYQDTCDPLKQMEIAEQR